MSLVDDVADFIAVHEGCAHCEKDGLIYAYICPAGFPTQGYGIRVSSKNVPPITKQEARERFKKVLPLYIAYALQLSPNLKDHPKQLIAITSFVYNLGPSSYAGSTLRKRVNAGDWAGAARELPKWVHGGGRRLPGLVTRRKAEAQLILT